MFLLKTMFRGSQEARFSLLIVSTVITQDLSYQHKSTGSPAISVVQGVRGKSSSAWWALSVLSAYNRRAKSSSLWFVSIINPPLWNQVPYFLGLVMLPQLGGRKFWCFIRSTEQIIKVFLYILQNVLSWMLDHSAKPCVTHLLFLWCSPIMASQVAQ